MVRRNAGFIGTDGINAPDKVTGVSASAGDTQASVSFTAPTDVGGSAITSFIATSNDGIGASGSSSPISVTGLSNGTSYTFRVIARNAFGSSAQSDASDSVTPASSRALFFGGYGTGTANARANVIDYVEISTTGNATDFGDLTTNSIYNGACSSSTRAVRGGGSSNAGSGGATSSMETMDYVTIASTGNAQDFGDLTTDRYRGDDGFSSSTRGIFGGGINESSTNLNVIEYITIASTGNGTDFGDLGAANSDPASFCSSTRGVFAGGQISSSATNIVQYITIDSTGNTTDFGDLSTATHSLAGCSSSTRGLIGGGNTGVNTIEYFTIASTGNATDFGDLTVARYFLSATSSSLRGVWGGGFAGISQKNEIDFVTIASTGDASDFGDLTVAGNGLSATSVSHGGLQ
jgi:hypothetical protein